jgi:hypothetical protein
MKPLLRIALVALVAALLWPEFARYRAEWTLSEANARLEAVLGGRLKGSAAVATTEDALRLTQDAMAALPGDARPIQSASVALLLLQRGKDAIALLEPAIAAGERPELTINLGRARGISGDDTGATAAFLRTAWSNPAEIATLPKSIREPLLGQVKELEQQLRDGHLKQPPQL